MCVCFYFVKIVSHHVSLVGLEVTIHCVNSRICLPLPPSPGNKGVPFYTQPYLSSEGKTGVLSAEGRFRPGAQVTIAYMNGRSSRVMETVETIMSMETVSPTPTCDYALLSVLSPQ